MSEDRSPDDAVQSNEPQRLTGGITGKGFNPGRSGNPGGMSKEHRAMLEVFRDKARRFSSEAYELLVDVAKRGLEDKDRLKAIEMLLDRAWGKPAQPIVGDDEAPPLGGGMTSSAQREALARVLTVLGVAPAADDAKPNE